MTGTQQMEKFVQIVDDFMAKYPAVTQYDKLKQLEQKTGYSKVYFFVASILFVVCLLTVLGGAKLIVDLVGFVYPAYMSFKSMDAGSHDDTQWLTYWVVFSLISIVESVFGFVINAIPFYYYLKIGVIVWMYYPATRGAETIYTQVVRPLLLPYLDSDKASKKAE